MIGDVTQCQGFVRYSVPCKHRVKVDIGGKALCAQHEYQRNWVKRLTQEAIDQPCTRPGHFCAPVMLRPETYQ